MWRILSCVSRKKCFWQHEKWRIARLEIGNPSIMLLQQNYGGGRGGGGGMYSHCCQVTDLIQEGMVNKGVSGLKD